MESDTPRGDGPTIAAIAILAACIVTADHEAIGHGSACLALGGHILKLTSVYFACSVKSPWIDIGGPLGNLIGGALAWIALRFVSQGTSRLRLLLTLITALALFWEAGYLLKAMIAADGDSYFAARDTLGEPQGWWRAAGCALGIALYGLGLRATASSARALALVPNGLKLCWLAATLASVAAAALYAPGPVDAMHQAALEIGVASWPLLILPRWLAAADGTAPQLVRSFGWIAGAVIVYALFAATLGHGLP